MFNKMIFGWVLAIGLTTVLFKFVLPEDDLKPITTYNVDPMTLSLSLRSGEAGRYDESIWEHIVALLPPEYLRQHVRQFRLFSDGLAQTLAYVEKESHEPEAWVLAVDRADYRFSKKLYFDSTIIHEFAHIIALEENQLSAYHWRCTNFASQDGCFKDTAYINQWYNRFWSGEIQEEHHLKVAGVKKSLRDDAREQFYDEHSDAFVSEYATTNAMEDFAESFVHYVLSEQTTDSGLVYAQKTAFFNQFPKLVEARQYIRSKLIQ